MQLRRLVLPAPFGPMTARSSPGWTESETSESAASPPKRSVRWSTCNAPGRPELVLTGKRYTKPMSLRCGDEVHESQGIATGFHIGMSRFEAGCDASDVVNNDVSPHRQQVVKIETDSNGDGRRLEIALN